MLPAVKVPLHLFLADGQSRGAAIYQAAYALAMAGAKGVDSEQMPKAAACAGCDCCSAPGLVPAAPMPPWQLLQARQAAPGMLGLLMAGTYSGMVRQAIHAAAIAELSDNRQLVIGHRSYLQLPTWIINKTFRLVRASCGTPCASKITFNICNALQSLHKNAANVFTAGVATRHCH